MMFSDYTAFSEILDAYAKVCVNESFKSSKPVTVTAYHGSNRKFDRFDMSHFNGGHGDGGSLGKGIYFADTKGLAKIWTDTDRTSYLYTVKIHFKNPFIISNEGKREQFAKSIGLNFNSSKRMNSFDDKKMKKFSDEYDGVISENERWEGDEEDEDKIEYHTQYCVYDMDDIEIIKVEEF